MKRRFMPIRVTMETSIELEDEDDIPYTYVYDVDVASGNVVRAQFYYSNPECLNPILGIKLIPDEHLRQIEQDIENRLDAVIQEAIEDAEADWADAQRDFRMDEHL